MSSPLFEIAAQLLNGHPSSHGHANAALESLEELMIKVFSMPRCAPVHKSTANINVVTWSIGALDSLSI